jgi:CheY-like chemotaxis protein
MANRKVVATEPSLLELMAGKIFGQPGAIEQIIPYVEMFQAGLAPENRPVGVFLLLGPTGTGKTRSVEALAEVLHGNAKSLLKIDCGEFQMQHEVAKLIGAPPGYLGHRETQPMLSQQKLTSVSSDKCGLSLVLFDEIEKAADSIQRILLGVLDKGILRLGDNSVCNFEKTIIFLTSNLGAREMMRLVSPEMGFQSAVPIGTEELEGKLENAGLSAVKRKFSPEFVNRIDAVITYRPLGDNDIRAICDAEVDVLQNHVNTRLGGRSFTLSVPYEVRSAMIAEGTSAEYGARELKRTVQKRLTKPLASLVSRGKVEPGQTVHASVDHGVVVLTVGSEALKTLRKPRVLIVDDNADLLQFLKNQLCSQGWCARTASTCAEARAADQDVDALLVDYLLPDGNGVELAEELTLGRPVLGPTLPAIIFSGGMPTAAEKAVMEEAGWPFIRKPFLASDLASQLRRLIDETRRLDAEEVIG